MSITLLTHPPQESDLTPLAEHQSHTPSTFFSGPAVLHHHARGASLVLSPHDLEVLPSFAQAPPAAETTVNGTDGVHESVVIPDIDVWVTSDTLILFSPGTSKGLAIPYPSIILHAIQRLRLPSSTESNAPDNHGLYMQIQTAAAETVALSNADDDDYPGADVLMTLVPAGPKDDDSTPAPADSTASTPAAVQALYDAVTACADLHPDAGLEGDEDGELDGEESGIPGVISLGVGGGLPPALPGSGGWITAENVGEFFDEEGNWTGGGLGPGAGRIRGREEVDGVNEGVDGDGEDGEDGHESRWRRTD